MGVCAEINQQELQHQHNHVEFGVKGRQNMSRDTTETRIIENSLVRNYFLHSKVCYHLQIRLQDIESIKILFSKQLIH